MTVGYMRLAATANVHTFYKLLFRWRGSVWKSVWRELMAWLWMYCIISIVYRFFLVGTPYAKEFEKLVQFMDNFTSRVNTSVTFVLGFYVSQVATRWWKVFMEIPWPDAFAMRMAAFYRDRKDQKHKEEDRITRCTIIRYMVLSYVLVFRDINERIRKRFPTYQHLVPFLMTDEEKKVIEHEEDRMRQWIPIEWCSLLLKKAYKNNQLDQDHYCSLIQELLAFRQRLNNLLSYDWVNLPLVYSQVVNVAIMVYFLSSLIARQYLGIKNHKEVKFSCDYVVPFFTMFEFIFYVGWLKVAQVMINPFGMDDDDFDIDCLIERNLQVALSMVDNFFDKVPKLVDLTISQLPHTKASYKALDKGNPMIGSVANIEIPKKDQRLVSANEMAKMKRSNNSLKGLVHRKAFKFSDIKDILAATPLVEPFLHHSDKPEEENSGAFDAKSSSERVVRTTGTVDHRKISREPTKPSREKPSVEKPKKAGSCESTQDSVELDTIKPRHSRPTSANPNLSAMETQAPSFVTPAANSTQMMTPSQDKIPLNLLNKPPPPSAKRSTAKTSPDKLPLNQKKMGSREVVPKQTAREKPHISPNKAPATLTSVDSHKKIKTSPMRKLSAERSASKPNSKILQLPKPSAERGPQKAASRKPNSPRVLPTAQPASPTVSVEPTVNLKITKDKPLTPPPPSTPHPPVPSVPPHDKQSPRTSQPPQTPKDTAKVPYTSKDTAQLPYTSKDAAQPPHTSKDAASSAKDKKGSASLKATQKTSDNTPARSKEAINKPKHASSEARLDIPDGHQEKANPPAPTQKSIQKSSTESSNDRWMDSNI